VVLAVHLPMAAVALVVHLLMAAVGHANLLNPKRRNP